ncbi:prephenate dehydrogenase/arogenate dehydrogenase family protein [Dyella humicola]|uniref:prephenate dehydrogenase/arogenate dehydrogenase family protein n=1 Tax=Dyella humicola TaxID=2992126 RepID=UPI00225A75E0|nr:prephenate dehydrogenase/arogenate dehydrogenase family protein [Dyella humicola]
MNFALLGYGRFGQAFAPLLQQAGHRVRVYDPQANVPEALTASSTAAAVANASWVVLAMPVPSMHEALLELRPLLHPKQTVIDVGSVKLRPCALIGDVLGAQIPHAGTHPLFGPLSLARDERPLRIVLCRSLQHPDAARRTRQLFKSLGCEVIDQDPVAHDRAMAETHALTFFIAKALVDMGIGEDLSMAPPSFLGLANMLAAVRGDAGHLFSAIQRENPYAPEARARLLDSLNAIHQGLLADGDRNSMSIPDLTNP